MEIDPRAFVEQQTRPGQPTMSKGFVTPRAQQVPQAQQGQAFVGGNTSQQTQNIAQDKFQQALDMANQGGYGGLAGGIAALFLGPKAAKLQEEVNKTQVKAENLKLEQGLLANSQAKNEIKIQEKKIEEINGMEALARLEANASENPQEDVKLAGGEMNEQGIPKLNYQKVIELQQSGKIPGNFNLQKIASHNPGLIMRMGQKYSKYTSEAVIKELTAAANFTAEQEMSDKRIAAATKGRGAEDQAKKDFDAFNKSSYGITKQLNELSGNVMMSADVRDGILQGVAQRINILNSFGITKGIISPDEAIDAQSMIETYRKAGTQNSLEAAAAAEKKRLEDEKANSFFSKVGKWFKKPQDAPDAVKTQKAPPLVSTPGAVQSKKETKQPKDPRLEGLGIPID